MGNNYIAKSKETVYAQILAAQRGDAAALDQLVVENSGLVTKSASRFNGMAADMEDLIQIGYIGLIKAIKKFDVKYDVMFSTYAVPMIIGEIKRFLRDDGCIKAGRSLKSEVYALRKAQADFMAEKGESPKLSELSAILNITKEHLLEIMEADCALGSITSLEAMLIDEEHPNYMAASSPELNLDAFVVKEGVKALPMDQKRVITLRYYRDMTQCEIAKILGISQVQVSRIEKKAIKAIKEKICI